MPNNSSETLQLGENLGFAAAAALRTALLERRNSDLVLDASDVEHLGASCLQVVLAAQKTWRDDGFSIDVRNCSPAFEESAQRLGFPISTLAQSEDT